MAGSALLERVTRGDHVCWIVEDEVSRLDTLAGVVLAGLRARDRVVYCGEDPEGLVAGVGHRGVPAAEAVASGNLRVSAAEGSLLCSGVFEPAAALSFLREEEARARKDKYSGLRVITDMSWASRSLPGADQVTRYEAGLNSFFSEGYLLGICAYDRRLFDPLSLRRHAGAHPSAAGPGMPFDPGSTLRMRRTRHPYGLRLEGEADMFNRQALSSVIARLVDDLPDDGTVIHVDVSGLRFADTAAARILSQAGDRAGGRLRLMGCSPALLRLLDFHGSRLGRDRNGDAERDTA
ncbi:MEDS domain-containing protein [Actinoplanes sp. NPDC049548]|uniref:MEDS domain-containing protein n=1 Tax=Actinoplanes sp. NPDC049548 TaxID=3155152 RepID=UPI00343432D8